MLNLQSLIILKPCCFGDVMFTTPLLGVLRRAYPDARIDFAVGSHARAAIEANPIIDNRIDSGKVGQGRHSLLDLFKLIRTLRATHYDAIFVPDRSQLLSLIALLSGIKIRVGLRGKFYTHRVESNVLKHEAELYLDLARAIDLDTHGAAVTYTPPAADQKTVLSLLSDNKILDKPFVLIHVGGGKNPGMIMSTKRWLPANFARLAMQLVREGGKPVALIGGVGDEPILDTVTGLINIPIINFGARTWGEIGALAARCELYIGNDTGATHMAVGAGARVLMIMGPSDPKRYAPYGDHQHVTYVWREWNVPKEGVRGGAKGFSWSDGVTVEDVMITSLKMLIRGEQLAFRL